MRPEIPLALALAGTLASLPLALTAQTGPSVDWRSPVPPSVFMTDPRFAEMWRWLDSQRHGPGMAAPFPLPEVDDSAPIPLPPITGVPDIVPGDTPPAAADVQPWLDYAFRLAAPTPRVPVDSDQNGAVSEEEAAAHAEAIFAAYDADRDGRLGEDEFQSMGAVMPFPGFTVADSPERASRFETLDGNGDGWVSKAEFLDSGRAHYEAARDTLTGEVTPWSYRRTDWY